MKRRHHVKKKHKLACKQYEKLLRMEEHRLYWQRFEVRGETFFGGNLGQLVRLAGAAPGLSGQINWGAVVDAINNLLATT